MRALIIATTITIAIVLAFIFYWKFLQATPLNNNIDPHSGTSSDLESPVPQSPITDVAAPDIARKAWIKEGGLPIPDSARVTVVRNGNIITVTFLPEKIDPFPKPGGDYIARVVIDATSGVVTELITSN